MLFVLSPQLATSYHVKGLIFVFLGSTKLWMKGEGTVVLGVVGGIIHSQASLR
jgi:hypothetical protein